MRVLICDRTGRLPLAVRWEARYQLERLGSRTRQLEAADIDLHSVRRAGTPAIEAELTLRTAQKPIRVAEVASDPAEAVERALQTLRSVPIDRPETRRGLTSRQS